MAYVGIADAPYVAVVAASTSEHAPEGEVEMMLAPLAGDVGFKRPRVFPPGSRLLPKSPAHPAVLITALGSEAPQDTQCVVWSDSKAFDLAEFVCSSCGCNRVMADLNHRMRDRLVRRVQRTLYADDSPCGRGAISCRACREKARDAAPKTSIMNAANKKKISGTLRMQLDLIVETGERKGQRCTAEKILTLGTMKQHRVFERDLYDEAWRGLVRLSGREAWSDDDSWSPR